MVAEDESMALIFHQVEAVAGTDYSVVINGESGTGKELIARSVHQAGPRKEQAFVPVNCASIPDTLFEREFFGHRKGAFTGAIANRKGRFQTAGKGTLFLDEIGELPLALQAKILRVLQEKQLLF